MHKIASKFWIFNEISTKIVSKSSKIEMSKIVRHLIYFDFVLGRVDYGSYDKANEQASDTVEKWQRYGGQGESLDLYSDEAVCGMNPFLRLCLIQKNPLYAG